jgi:ABC-2 type transport system permease protein
VNRERLGAIVWKEFIQMRRDPATLGLMLGVPIIQLLLFGYAIRMDVRHLPTAVFDQSRTQESRLFTERLEATDNFRITRAAASYEDALALVNQGRVRAAFVIPPDFANDLKRGRPASVQVLVDATDPNASQNAIAAAQMVGQQASLALLGQQLGAAVLRPPIDVRVRPLYNPALRSAIFIVPGIIGLILSITLMIITALSIVRERERGTLEQLIVTPLSRSEIMIGKIAPYVAVGYVQMTAVLLVGHYVFSVPIRGNVLQAQSMQSSYLFVMPNVLLSGFMFPREGMPPVAKQLGLAIPLTYFLQLIRGVVLKGVGLRELWPQTLALALFALIFFAFSVRRFRKQLE